MDTIYHDMNLTQEQKLLNLINSPSNQYSGYVAVHIFLSKLSEKNRNTQQIKIAQSIVGKNVSYSNTSIFVLSNFDIIVVAKNTLLRNIYTALDEIKKFFANDILIINNYENNFSKIYSLEYQFDDFKMDLGSLIEGLEEANQVSGHSGSHITPDVLEDVLVKVEAASLKNAIKKQDIIYIGPENIGKIFFEEFYISLDLLKKQIGIDTNLIADKWLFHHLSETLDRKMLSSLSNMDLQYYSDISLNLNLRSIDSPEFNQFIRNYDKKLIIELQIADIFEDIKYYKHIRKTLQADGHKIAIDSVNEETIKLLDIDLLKPDYVKLLWNPSYLMNNQNVMDVRNFVDKVGGDKIVLCRCTNEAAIAWGLERKISIYQGFFVDSIISAMIKKQCEASEMCDGKECVAKRNFASYDMKTGCHDIFMLEKDPHIKLGGLK